MSTTYSRPNRRVRPGQLALGTTLLAGLIGQAYAQTAPATEQKLDTVVVTGIRSSLAASALEKRENIGLSDSIHAEDIGKFPDNNLAESISRIPGVQVNRDVTGEGLNIQVRGLGANFTRILMNGNPVASASTSFASAGSANREVDLDFMPGDLFSRITVSKSPLASMLEGGVAGVVNMRNARPFDKPGTRGTVKLQLAKNDPAPDPSTRGTAIVSTTFGDTFGVLAGVSFARNKITTRGFEDGTDWVTPRLTNPLQTGAGTSTTNGAWGVPTTVPAAAAGTYGSTTLTAGQAVNMALLQQLNPKATIQQIDNGYMPRLPRPVNFSGERDRTNGLLSFEFRPTADFNSYLDLLIGGKKAKQERADFDINIRNSAVIPSAMTYDRSDCSVYCFVTGGTLLNGTGFLEYRRMDERSSFTSVNPGFEWRISDKWTLDAQANQASSRFSRLAPTLLVPTDAAKPFTVNIGSNGTFPVYTPNGFDPNSPANYTWDHHSNPTGAQISINREDRSIQTRGARWNLAWGDDKLTVKGGMAYDTYHRLITPFTDDGRLQNVVCGGNLNVRLYSPNNVNPNTCSSAAVTANPATQYPGYGQGATAGGPALAYQGSAVPDISKYLIPGPNGFVLIDWSRFAGAVGYDNIVGNMVQVAGSNALSGAAPQDFAENVFGSYIEVAGETRVFDRLLRYDLGVRRAHTMQTVGAYTGNVADPRNASLSNGGLYPYLVSETQGNTSYNNTLPSGTLAYNLTSDMIIRAAASKAITRADPKALQPLKVTSNDVALSNATATNPGLKPFESKNMDLGWEWYTDKKGSYLAAAYFDKKIKNFPRTVVRQMTLTQIRQQFGSDSLQYTAGSAIDQAVTAAGGPDNFNIPVSQPVNTADVLKLNGWELSWAQSLDRFLPIDGFGFYANYTRTKQDAGTSGQVPIGAAPYTANLTVYFENSRGSIRLSNSYQARTPFESKNTDSIPAGTMLKYNKAYFQADLSTRLEIGDWVNWKKGVSLNFDITNLNKATQKSYIQDELAVRSYWDPGRTYQLTAQMKF
ncbi:TonB-dependent receptor [Roseateles sp. BYS78W]|uniref:TonB-dependent receptor n=1 Tax=Pelomonas candidula TaxID=3299025 RepID=A0ABW7HAR4_9BURK